jgi:sugar phosphate isomerase/epimerase
MLLAMSNGNLPTLSRRGFTLLLGVSALAVRARGANKKIPVGLELFSVRKELAQNEPQTLQSVAKMGYECVEFFSPYYDWTTDHAKDVRKQLDDLGLKCYSTHNGPKSFSSDGVSKAIDLNKILGAKYVVMASPGKTSTLDDWKKVAETLNKANAAMKHSGLHAGYHNHIAEWKPLGDQVPMVVLADNTDKSVMLQLDVGHCVAAGADPVQWIDAHPGRIRSMHLKDWSPEKHFDVLIGEGIVKWNELLQAAETKGGVEYYLIEQEGGPYSENEAADKSLIAFKNIKR